MLSVYCSDEINFTKCGTEDTKVNLAFHKKRCSVGTFNGAKIHNFLTISHADLNFPIAKKQSLSLPKIAHECQLCH